MVGIVRKSGWVVAILFFTSPVWAGQNLLVDGGFESGSDLRGWAAESYQPGFEYRTTMGKSHSGKASLLIRSPRENDVRLIQTVPVKPDTCYRFSGYIATDHVSEKAANLCVVSGFNHSRLIGGSSEWSYVEFNFRTATDQHQVTLGARLGMWGNTASGTAYFDDLNLTELTAAPPNITQLTAESGPAQPNPLHQENKTGHTLGFWIWVEPLAILVVFFVLILAKKKTNRMCS